MTKDELYTWYQDERDKISQETFAEGKIKACDSSEQKYKVLYGKNIDFTIQCNKEWGQFILNTILNIQHSYADSQFHEIVNNLPFHDSHWNWVSKYCCLNAEKYDWFYIISDNSVQAVCITYHPKKSLFDGNNIFYIEYIAVAPWNRKSKFIVRKFHGLGSLLIKTVCRYYYDICHYRLGFPLSAVPQAKEFYENIGMTPFPEYDKDQLFFYEMSPKNTELFLGGAK